jgi:hypothetical protein
VDEAEARLRGAGFGGGSAPAAPVQQSILDASPEPPRAPGAVAGPAGRAQRFERPRGAMGEPSQAGAISRGTAPAGRLSHDTGGPAGSMSPTAVLGAEVEPASAPASAGSRTAVESGSAPGRSSSRGAAESAGAPSDLEEAWQRVTDEVKGKRALLGAVLAQVRPAGLARGVLTLVLEGNQFHRDRLLEPLNQDILGQAVRRWVTGAERFTLAMEGEGDGGGPRAHPAVQAAIAEFQGEVVAIRARSPEGDAS